MSRNQILDEDVVQWNSSTDWYAPINHGEYVEWLPLFGESTSERNDEARRNGLGTPKRPGGE